MEKGYANFLKARLRCRIEFIENYGKLYPEYFFEEDLQFLNSISLAEANFSELSYLQEKVSEIENQVESTLKNYSSEIQADLIE